MVKTDKLYMLLEEMLDCALECNERKLKKLNRSYESLMQGEYFDTPTSLNPDYDNFRQSCLLSCTMLHACAEFIYDAKERLDRISRNIKKRY